jgi:hypothetical protein
VAESAEAPARGARRLDRILAPGYLDEIKTLPLAEVRLKREECEQEEADLSYLRRVLQGRIDIVQAELDRRAGGGGGSLLADLPRILSDPRGTAHGLGRHSTVEPSRADEHRRYVERLVANVDLSDVSERDEGELEHGLDVLREEENDISSKRKQLHAILDACGREITRRYRDGEADVGDLLVEG